MRPETDAYPDQLERVATALAAGDTATARVELEPIAYAPQEVPARSEPSETVIASIYRRDRFRCRYCGQRVIPTQIMRLIAELLPEQFPWHPNWKGGATHPAFAARSATLDHVVPWTAGGRNDPDNLVCACWPCNAIKGNLALGQLGWELLPIVDDGWDGLTRFYRPLWELAGAPRNAEHPLWVKLYSAPMNSAPRAARGRRRKPA